MTYAGLTTADKPALLDAKARGAEWVARDEDEELVGFRRKPKRYIDMESTSDHWERTESENYFIAMPNDEPLQFIQWSDPDPVNIDLALAQIAEMESKPIDESATDDIVLAEVYSLREKLKIAADIIHKLDPNYDVTEFLHQVGSADYDQREEDLAPLTCAGCRLEAEKRSNDKGEMLLITCLKCMRSEKTDRYEPKGDATT
ncbi:MAG: hypothetical protein ABFC56_09100 [Clostridiaceae bacterium]